MGICACKRCLVKAAPAAGGAAPVFSSAQEKTFALHMLAVLRPHIADFTAARDAEASSWAAVKTVCYIWGFFGGHAPQTCASDIFSWSGTGVGVVYAMLSTLCRLLPILAPF